MTHENYPCRIIVISNSVTIAIYLIGLYIMSQIGFIWACIYLLYILGLEIRLMSRSCINCYYYGKRCAFGKGKLAARFFKKGKPEDFINRKISWEHIVPDFLVALIPLIFGVALLILNFNWLILILIILLVILTSAGNGFIRSALACKYCKQKAIGCPAEQLFNKNRK